MEHAQDADEDDTESAQSEIESDSELDNYNSESSVSSNEPTEHVDIEERTEELGNKKVTFNLLGSSEENNATYDVGARSEENNIPVISESLKEGMRKKLETVNCTMLYRQ